MLIYSLLQVAKQSRVSLFLDTSYGPSVVNGLVFASVAVFFFLLSRSITTVEVAAAKEQIAAAKELNEKQIAAAKELNEKQIAAAKELTEKQLAAAKEQTEKQLAAAKELSNVEMQRLKDAQAMADNRLEKALEALAKK